jgi:hypothetical protein
MVVVSWFLFLWVKNLINIYSSGVAGYRVLVNCTLDGQSCGLKEKVTG